MDRPLRSRPIRIGVAAVALVVGAFYVYAVYSVWRADWLRGQIDLGSLEASAHLQPWNAKTQWLLGRYSLNVTQDYVAALTFLQRAVELNPYEGRCWLDLAEARQVRGETNESQAALERALGAEPASAEIAWEAANSYLVQNNIERALPLLRAAIQYDANNTAPAIDLSWRATKNVGQIVSRVLPAQPQAYFSFLKILTARNQSSAANELWHDLIAQGFRFPVEEAFPYFDYLIRDQQIDQASQVWTDLSKIHPEVRDDIASNLVRNGGFEAEFLNGGFDWRRDPTGQINVALDTSELHSGARSLRIEFTGPALSDVGVYELVPVQPNTAYRLSAFVKTADVTSASGPRLAIEESSTRKMLGTTDEFLETSSWMQRTAVFVTGTETRLLTLRILRIPGNPLIKGTLWLDDIELTPVSSVQRANP
ncbi:MAG TPA: carbohydrate binding domain-containing protein [Terriglobales bacterium]|jgi:tetratricopeptide (TPR) repeat protein|nr:carbohydrate binding domain-containing protein [Terriglobales bacterium]